MPSVCQKADLNTSRMVDVVWMATPEYTRWTPVVTRCGENYLSMASSENHMVMEPRRFRATLYSRQLRSL